MIRLAIIGDRETVAAYAKIADRIRGARVVAIVDDKPSAQRAALFGADVLTVSMAELLDRHADQFDAAVIQATSGPCLDTAGALANANKHLLLDARLVDSIHTVEALIKSFETSATTLAVGNPLRFQPDVQAVHESVAGGKLGAPGLLRVHRWKPHEGDAPGDAIFFDLTAEIDLACWLFDATPTIVFARQQAATASDSIHSVQVHLGFPQGGMALIDVARGLPSESEYETHSVIGSTGAVYADDHHDMQLMFQGGTNRAVGIDWRDRHLLPQIQDFVDAIATDRQPLSSLDAARAAIQVADAVTKSIETGEAVSF